ncbi:hypothetical protein SH580_19695 [Coraliomargarita algicola]|uniref:Uncharacterized protein n=1 Tax=Coraliomargarita algicola TaxID=3092156 RepID=A0ABZ0RLJ5_9BACT|nr:hypothetical protein [Coraliomargarita sp. J2-16]WPJ95645.1 hypothetical protein SH580_19695 [Coraliomargarita sp. J2-16]
MDKPTKIELEKAQADFLAARKVISAAQNAERNERLQAEQQAKIDAKLSAYKERVASFFDRLQHRLQEAESVAEQNLPSAAGDLNTDEAFVSACWQIAALRVALEYKAAAYAEAGIEVDV